LVNNAETCECVVVKWTCSNIQSWQWQSTSRYSGFSVGLWSGFPAQVDVTDLQLLLSFCSRWISSFNLSFTHNAMLNCIVFANVPVICA